MQSLTINFLSRGLCQNPFRNIFSVSRRLVGCQEKKALVGESMQHVIHKNWGISGTHFALILLAG